MLWKSGVSLKVVGVMVMRVSNGLRVKSVRCQLALTLRISFRNFRRDFSRFCGCELSSLDCANSVLIGGEGCYEFYVPSRNETVQNLYTP